MAADAFSRTLESIHDVEQGEELGSVLGTESPRV